MFYFFFCGFVLAAQNLKHPRTIAEFPNDLVKFPLNFRYGEFLFCSNKPRISWSSRYHRLLLNYFGCQSPAKVTKYHCCRFENFRNYSANETLNEFEPPTHSFVQ